MRMGILTFMLTYGRFNAMATKQLPLVVKLSMAVSALIVPISLIASYLIVVMWSSLDTSRYSGGFAGLSESYMVWRVVGVVCGIASLLALAVIIKHRRVFRGKQSYIYQLLGIVSLLILLAQIAFTSGLIPWY